MRWKTNWNSNEHPPYNEAADPLSKTIPEQTMSVSDMLRRHKQGLSIVDGKVPIYHMDAAGEPLDLPDLRTLDMAELQLLREEAALNSQRIKDQLNRLEQERQQAKLESIKKQREADQKAARERQQLEQQQQNQSPYHSRSAQPGVSHPGAMEGLVPDSGG